MKIKQSGFTAVEMVIVISTIASVAVAVGVICVACHFLAKFW